MNEQELLKYWQERLGLQDWFIVLKYNLHMNDLASQNAVGECDYSLTGKSAVIRILDRKHYGDRIIPYNFEKTLVHELLHCKFALIAETENAIQDRFVHQLIDDMAKSLVPDISERIIESELERTAKENIANELDELRDKLFNSELSTEKRQWEKGYNQALHTAINLVENTAETLRFADIFANKTLNEFCDECDRAFENDDID